MLAFSLITSILGILLNVFVLMVFCLHKKACTVPEIYMSNLAAADLVLVSCLPFWAVYVGNKFNWLFGSFLCKLVPASISINAYCSIYFLVLVSLDRYMALVHPLTLERLRRPKYAKLSCVVVWGVGLLLNNPMFIYRKVKNSSQTNTTLCYLNYPVTHKQLFDTMMIIFSFIIPISIIFYCTFKIILALNNRVMHGLNTQKMEKKATTLVLVVLFAFLICWVPLYLMRIILLFIDYQILGGCSLWQFLVKYSWIFMNFAYSNSVLNPIL
uniref:G-protein coupled receptors family 1 profile domain-containing protein n=1 Tax=Monopterus albus TaxID=43700 RepID=A0A3Q3QAG0_MONAL